MTTITDIFRQFGPEYIDCFSVSMPDHHHKVIRAIMKCRTPEYGMTFYKCEGCGELHSYYRSCGNRHCPSCQINKSHAWLEKQLNRQVPGHHFMITFTVPSQIRMFIRSNPKTCYSALFKASSQALMILAAEKKYIGGDLPGFFGVLHTWGRQLQYHPHIHYVVPGGALCRKSGLWLSSRIDFYVHIVRLSRTFRALFKKEMSKAGLLSDILGSVWKIDWNVNIQAVGKSRRTVKYLAPYVFKVAISNSRITGLDDRTVSFKYKVKNSNRMRNTALDVMEFIRRFLQHVLPTGFMKVRYYGFLHPCSKVSLTDIRALIELSYGFNVELPDEEQKSNSEYVHKCPTCGEKLIYSYSILPHQMIPEMADSS